MQNINNLHQPVEAAIRKWNTSFAEILLQFNYKANSVVNEEKDVTNVLFRALLYEDWSDKTCLYGRYPH